MSTQSLPTRASGAAPPERITGEPVFDAQGNPSSPSSALVFEPTGRIPTMLVERELNYLKWLASRTTGAGRIVELGCFLGGSTEALVAGIDESTVAEPAPILTYDAFETIDDESPTYLSLLNLYGLAPAQRFRDRFDTYNSPWLDRVSVREGWLPADASVQQERGVYPEQEPIELLFVDVAKTWDVHLTVLRAFGRHLRPGSMVVQQDFFDLQTPWIPLHMYQLRDVLRPIDVLRGTPSLGLACQGDLSAHFGDLWTESQFGDRLARREVWDAVLAYWGGLIGDADAGFIAGHAAMHAFQSGDIEDAIGWARRYEAWSRSSESNGVYFSPAWPEIVETLTVDLSADAPHADTVRTFSAECVARGSRLTRRRPGERGTYRPIRQRREYWTATAGEVARRGHRRIALFGAGRHTAWLLGESILREAGIEVVCVIDDAPREETLFGVPVVASSDVALTDDLGAGDFSAVLPSSDTFEARLMTRLFALFPSGDAGGGPEIVRVYSDPDRRGEQEEPNWEYSVEIAPGVTRGERTNPERVTGLGPDRPRLGLDARRPWAERFCDRYRVPAWCDNFAHAHELAFMWDVIEASRPTSLVEIGTASGVSTAMLTAGACELCGDDAMVYSFDIATECYFDRGRPLASAIAEMAPDLVDRVRLFAGANAMDAASCFPVGGVDFAFIDGEHGHPAPTLDLLAMVHALKPGAWVVLHDIELSNFSEDVEGVSWADSSGAARLFARWPFEKVQPTGATRADRNLGAIRMPGDPDEAIPHLLANLKGPIEIGGDEAVNTRKALAILRG